MSVFNPKRHPTAPVNWGQPQRADTIHGALRELSGAYATCLVSFRAFRNPGFRHDRAAFALCQLDERWKCPHFRAFLSLNRATVVQRGAYRFCSPRAVVCFDLLRLSRSHAPNEMASRPFERNCPSGKAGWRLRFTRTTCRWLEHAKNKDHVQRTKKGLMYE